jgi:hypothetical protein
MTWIRDMPTTGFPVNPGEAMPVVNGCRKQDYARPFMANFRKADHPDPRSATHLKMIFG